jgi:hypothetical protein
MHRCLFAVLQLLLVYGASTGQVPGKDSVINYTQIFGDKYTEAEHYLALQHWITDTLIAQGISPAFGKSIIFPEVIRYSAIRDKLELQGLFTLYVQYGTKYSNFSVGRFQMKPSFARLVERDVSMLPGIFGTASGSVDTLDTPEARLSRVKRLESPEWQLQYLIWFIKIMDQRYGAIYQGETTDKLKFYATAYNCGYTNTAQVIRQNMQKNSFHTAIFSSDVCYNYGDIACAYYSSR